MHIVPLTTGVPALASRMRLPRHQHAQRDQAIADALELVRRLEQLTEGMQTVQPLEDDEKGYENPRTPGVGVNSADTPTHSVRTTEGVHSVDTLGGTRSASTPGRPCGCDYAVAVNHDEILRLINSPDAADAIALIEWGDRWGALTERGDEEFMAFYGYVLGETPAERFPVFPEVLDEFAKLHPLVDSVRAFAIIGHIDLVNRRSEFARKDQERRCQEIADGAEIMDRIDAEMGATTELVEQLVERTRNIAADIEIPPTPYERIRAQRDRVWVDWGDDGAPDHPDGDQEARWHAQGITEGLAMAMTVLEQEGQR